MNRTHTAFLVATLAAVIAAILLGHAAGTFYNAGLNPAGTRAFALAILASFVAGGFAFGASRSFTKKVPPPAPPVDPTRRHCVIGD